ncbi:MAG: cytidylate kinase-like family protein [Clostridia bacterium]|nr:cytidylate kinase-like family protein [Clostridia bacterium]
MKIITVSREFGSGGREIGKRLADELGFAYYDKEIVAEIAKRHALDENYVRGALDKSVAQSYPLHFGRTFSYSAGVSNTSVKLFAEQTKIIREFAEARDCVIVGRAADVILSEYKPFNLFVYASMESKVKRCLERAEQGEEISERDTAKMIKRIDSERKKIHGMISDTPWGDRRGYHLCVNTTGLEIKEIVPGILQYVNVWFDSQK